LGCGAGANIPFLKQLGMDYYAIEGSIAIVEEVLKKYPEYKGKIVQGDFTQDIPFNENFDLIVDRASLTHNDTESIKRCIYLVKSRLVSKGTFIGIDWFSTLHSEFKKGTFTEDVNTKSFLLGQFAGLGNVHFSDKQHLLSLFDEFEITQLEHKIIMREIPSDNHQLAFWNFVARKLEK
jgi:SAM-dependent methyltransferase